MDITTLVIAALSAAVGLLVGVLLGQREAAKRYGDLRAELQSVSASAVADSSEQVFAMADASFRATQNVVAPVQQTLSALTIQLAGLERNEASWQGELRQQIESVRTTGVELRAETQTLVEALRTPRPGSRPLGRDAAQPEPGARRAHPPLHVRRAGVSTSV